MNIGSFAIGIVTVFVFGLIIATIIGLLKVTSLAKEMLMLKRRLEDDERELSREINMVERTLQNSIQHTNDNVYRHLEEAHRQSTSYTDKRIDKLIDTYFEHKKNKKEVLKD